MFATEVLIVETLSSMLLLAFSKVEPKPDVSDFSFLSSSDVSTNDSFNAIICLGAVIRGATPHFDYVAGESASGIAQVSYATGIPTIFGIITTDTINQAIERAGAKLGNKGSEAATAAIELINLYKQIDQL